MFVVVTVLALSIGWFTWELRFIRERSMFLADDEAVFYGYGGWSGLPPYRYGSSNRIPPWRRMLGDRALQWIMLHRENVDGIARAQRLFPEAEVEIAVD